MTTLNYNKLLQSGPGRFAGGVDYHETNRDLDEEEKEKNDPGHFLKSARHYGLVDCRQPHSSQKTPQMSVPVDARVYTRRRKDQHEEKHRQGRTVQLALDHRTQQVNPVPVEYYVPEYHSDHAVESSWSPSSQKSTFVNSVAEYIARDPGQQIDDKRLRETKCMLNSRHQEESTQNVSKEMQQIDMQKNCWN